MPIIWYNIRNGEDMTKYILIIIYLICTTGGITFMKLGGDSLKLSFKNGFLFQMGGKTFIGFLLYLISFLLWQRLVVKFDLSKIVPITTGLVQIIVLIISIIVFKDKVSTTGITGIVFVILGIILMSLK
jgi:drug/metabolite transporter (DMT)-like permease